MVTSDISLTDEEVYLLLRSLQYTLSNADSDKFAWLADQGKLFKLRRLETYFVTVYQRVGECKGVESIDTPSKIDRRWIVKVVNDGIARYVGAESSLESSSRKDATEFKSKTVAYGIASNKKHFEYNQQVYVGSIDKPLSEPDSWEEIR